MSARRQVFLLLAALLPGCTPPHPPPQSAVEPAGLQFSEAAAAAGIRFVHDAGLRRPRPLTEATGPGLAWLDIDGDGWPDLAVANGNPELPAPNSDHGLRLWRNNRDGAFTDVTERAGLNRVPRNAIGVAVGDFDGDGRDDLYVTCIGPNALFRNRGDGTFEDMAGAAGAAGPAALGGAPKWSTAAVFFDADGDGDLDLYVANYCAVRATDPLLQNTGGLLTTPPATIYAPQPDLFFCNDGHGHFTEASREMGFAVQSPERGLCTLAFDADGDGVPELFVGNESSRSFLFRRQPDGRYHEVGFASGVAVGEAGADRTARSAAVGDVNGDGRPDLLVSNAQNEPVACYVNLGGCHFIERGTLLGLAAATRRTSGYGVAFLDPDLDGTGEILKVNGHPNDAITAIEPEVAWEQASQLFRYAGTLFSDVSRASGSAPAARIAGRSCAVADYDGDGDPDAAVSVNGGPLQLWRCDAPSHGHWLELRLLRRGSNRGTIGARVTLTVGSRHASQQVTAGGVYLGDIWRPLLFGLGPAQRVDAVEITWPGGRRQVIRNVEVDQAVSVSEGGSPVPRKK